MSIPDKVNSIINSRYIPENNPILKISNYMTPYNDKPGNVSSLINLSAQAIIKNPQLLEEIAERNDVPSHFREVIYSNAKDVKTSTSIAKLFADNDPDFAERFENASEQVCKKENILLNKGQTYSEAVYLSAFNHISQLEELQTTKQKIKLITSKILINGPEQILVTSILLAPIITVGYSGYSVAPDDLVSQSIVTAGSVLAGAVLSGGVAAALTRAPKPLNQLLEKIATSGKSYGRSLKEEYEEERQQTSEKVKKIWIKTVLPNQQNDNPVMPNSAQEKSQKI